MRLDALFNGTSIEREGAADRDACGIRSDSREVEAGDVFFALSDDPGEAERHALDAAGRGASAIVAAHSFSMGKATPLFLSARIREDLAIAARRFYGVPDSKMDVFAVTGTNGKTTTVRLLHAIWREADVRSGYLSSIDRDLGSSRSDAALTTPGAPDLYRFLAQMAACGCRACFLEASSHGIHQKRLYGMAFRSRILTSVSTDHLDYHGDLDSYRRVKEDFLAEGDDLSVVNADDAVGGRVAKRKRRTVAFSCSRPDADLFAEETGGSAVDEGLKLEARHRGGDRFRLDVPGVPGGFLAENILAAVLTALENGIDVSTIRRALEKFSLPRGRMNRIDGPRGIAVYIDYAHTPDALEKVLRCLRPKAAGRLRVVFGCGGNRDRTKRPVMGRIAGTLADAVYLTADNSRFEQTGAILDEIREGIPDAPEVFVIPDRGRAISRAVADCGEGDVVLIAGKGHETYQEIEGVRRPWSDFDRANRALFGERKEGCA